MNEDYNDYADDYPATDEEIDEFLIYWKLIMRNYPSTNWGTARGESLNYLLWIMSLPEVTHA